MPLQLRLLFQMTLGSINLTIEANQETAVVQFSPSGIPLWNKITLVSALCLIHKQPCQDCPWKCCTLRYFSLSHVPFNYPQQGQCDHSSQNHLWFSRPTFVHRFVALTFLGRHEQTFIHLDGELVADSSIKVQLSKPVAYLERTGKWVTDRNVKTSPPTATSLQSLTPAQTMTSWEPHHGVTLQSAFPMCSSTSWDYLQLGWAVARSHGWHLRRGCCNTSLLPPLRACQQLCY